jgi:hypothetical protein
VLEVVDVKLVGLSLCIGANVLARIAPLARQVAGVVIGNEVTNFVRYNPLEKE